jgi:spore germination protein
MTLNSALSLAIDTESKIQFDELSQTPYFNYQLPAGITIENHEVWGIDARSINAIDDLIVDYDLIGSGIWNIMNYYQQLWTLTNSRFNILKLIPEKI